MSDEKRVATAEILNTSVHVSVKLNDRYQGPRASRQGWKHAL